VLICCGLGLGRSVAVAAAWLVRHAGYSPQDDLRHIKKQRPQAVIDQELVKVLALMELDERT